MSDEAQLRNNLLKIGPDHETDVGAAYAELLAAAEKRDLELLLPALIAPYLDEAVSLDDPKNWVPVHAWRLLRDLHSSAGLLNMLSVADHPDDQLAYSEFSDSAVAAGPDAARVLLPIVDDTAKSDTQRILAVKSLTALAQKFENLSGDVVTALVDLIAGESDPGGDINGFAAEGLMALGADSAALVETAYNAGKVQVGSVRAAVLGTHFGFEP